MDQWVTRQRMRLEEEIAEERKALQQAAAEAARKRRKQQDSGRGSGSAPSTPSRSGKGRGKEGVLSPRQGKASKGAKFLSGKDAFIEDVSHGIAEHGTHTLLSEP